MTNVIKIPVKKRYPRTVRGKEIWNQAEPSESMVWEICPYIRSNLENCNHCPRWEFDEVAARYTKDGIVQRGCYGLADEACRIVFAMQKRQRKRPWWRLW